MSLQLAIDELRQRIINTGLTEYPDLRINSLLDAGSSAFDGHFIIRSGLLVPWPEIGIQPKAWITDVRVEIGAVVQNDLQQTVNMLNSQLVSLTRELRYSVKQHSTLWGFSQPTILRLLSNPSMIVAQLVMKMRFTTP